jgi:hypothetical protein
MDSNQTVEDVINHLPVPILQMRCGEESVEVRDDTWDEFKITVPRQPDLFIPHGETSHAFEALAMLMTAVVIYGKRGNLFFRARDFTP